MVIVHSIFVVHTQQISCDVRNFVSQRKMAQVTLVQDRVVRRGLLQNFPNDLQFQPCFLQTPNMPPELSTESLVGVVKRRFVIGKSCFKRVLSESNIHRKFGLVCYVQLSLLLGKPHMI